MHEPAEAALGSLREVQNLGAAPGLLNRLTSYQGPQVLLCTSYPRSLDPDPWLSMCLCRGIACPLGAWVSCPRVRGGVGCTLGFFLRLPSGFPCTEKSGNYQARGSLTLSEALKIVNIHRTAVCHLQIIWGSFLVPVPDHEQAENSGQTERRWTKGGRCQPL